jgi:hypothetical protein
VVLCERWWLVGPPASALRGRALNHPVVRWLKTVVLSDREKAWLDCVRWGPGRRSRSARPGRSGWVSSLSRRKGLVGIEIGGPASSPEMSLAGARVPGQVVSGVEAA